jgi:hypothetical protein
MMGSSSVFVEMKLDGTQSPTSVEARIRVKSVGRIVAVRVRLQSRTMPWRREAALQQLCFIELLHKFVREMLTGGAAT